MDKNGTQNIRLLVILNLTSILIDFIFGTVLELHQN